MPFDFPYSQYGGGDSSTQRCLGCKLPLGAHEPVVRLRFDQDAGPGLDEMNGLYHAECADPLVKLAKTLETLRRAASLPL